MLVTQENIFLLIFAIHGLYCIYFDLLKLSTKKINKIDINTKNFYIKIFLVYGFPILVSGALFAVLGKIVNSLSLYILALVAYIALKLIASKIRKWKILK
jgi:hypothetical protein